MNVFTDFINTFSEQTIHNILCVYIVRICICVYVYNHLITINYLLYNHYFNNYLLKIYIPILYKKLYLVYELEIKTTQYCDKDTYVEVSTK